MTSPEDPWRVLQPSSKAGELSARRVSEREKWGFYWAMDSRERCMLILRQEGGGLGQSELPHLNGIDLTHEYTAGKASLVWSLTDPRLRDIFHDLCLDIVNVAGKSIQAPHAIATAISQTWRWHHLLRGGSKALLTEDQQKGLIGELLVLELHLLPRAGPARALDAWGGPLGAAQDFTLGQIGIESKARSSHMAGTVPISSEFQLDDARLARLFLHIAVVNRAEAETNGAYTLSDVVARVRQHIAAVSSDCLPLYDGLLAAAGFRYGDDYSAFPWTGGEHAIYDTSHVNFPRITPTMLPDSVKNVRYEISLTAHAACVVGPDTVDAVLAGSEQ